MLTCDRSSAAPRALLPIALILLTLASSGAPAAAVQDDREAVVEVIYRANDIVHRAYETHDISELETVFTGEALEEARSTVIFFRQLGVQSEIRSVAFEITSVTFPSPGRAVVETDETWQVRQEARGQVLEELSRSLQVYELELINGQWFVSLNDVITELMPIP